MTRKRTRRGVSPEVAHGKLVLDLERAESKMRRAFRAWDRALEAVKKSSAKLDRLFKERTEIGGTLSPSDFAEANNAIHDLAVEGAARLRGLRREGR